MAKKVKDIGIIPTLREKANIAPIDLSKETLKQFSFIKAIEELFYKKK